MLNSKGTVLTQWVVNIPAKLPIADDTAILFAVVDKLKHLTHSYDIDLVCIELPTFSSSSLRSKQLNMLFGAILQGLAIPYLVCNATTVKKYATGSGRHTKETKKTVMQEAWKRKDLSSYTKAVNTLPTQWPKSTKDRAIGDLADSYWLAHYGLTMGVPEVSTNPDAVVTEIDNNV